MDKREREFTSGFVGMAGVPNVGKSTLVNRIVGQKVSITSRCPQTTRHRICGILTTERTQAVLVDIPGILETGNAFNQGLVACAEDALLGCDLVCFLRSADTAGSEDEGRVVELLTRLRAPIWEVWNKVDRLTPPRDRPAGPTPERSFLVSARTGRGVEALARAMGERLPPGPELYPAEDVSDRNLRFLCAEMVREKVFQYLQQEVPYGVATWTEEWTERDGGQLYLRVIIQTDKASHKGIIIGGRGEMLKRIGAAARREIERLCDGPVYLDLWVQVRDRWRRDPGELERLGLGRPERH